MIFSYTVLIHVLVIILIFYSTVVKLSKEARPEEVTISSTFA